MCHNKNWGCKECSRNNCLCLNWVWPLLSNISWGPWGVDKFPVSLRVEMSQAVCVQGNCTEGGVSSVLCTVSCNVGPPPDRRLSHMGMGMAILKVIEVLFMRGIFSLWSSNQSLRAAQPSVQLSSGVAHCSSGLSRVLSRILSVKSTTRETLGSPLSDQMTERDHKSSWHQWMANYAVTLSADTWRAEVWWMVLICH